MDRAAEHESGRQREMSGSREKRAGEIQDAIRQILHRDWDPIGIAGTAPDDEDDSYIAGVCYAARPGEEL